MFLLILGKAVWREEGSKTGNIIVNKGQWLRSYRNLQSDLEYIENNAVKRPGLATIKRTVEKLVTDGRITIQATELGTLFTVVNYCKYQDLETYKKKARNDAKNSSGTAAEQQRNNNNKGNKDNKEDNISLFPKEETAEEFNQSLKFNEFWSEYPKKLAKKDAEKAWSKIKMDEIIFGIIMDGLSKAKKSEDWNKEDGKYIPYPASWLNGERWKDEHKQQNGEEDKTYDNW